MSPSTYTIAAMLVVLAQSGCAGLQPATGKGLRPDDRGFISREDIRRSGATNGWDALKGAGTFLSLGEGASRRGGDVRATSRGRTSLLLSPQLLLVVDNALMMDLAYLKDIRADNIAWIRVLGSVESTMLYGAFGGNGAILVRTAVPDDGASP